ncbi:22589_t:CDS:2, partial [Gigaspora rosea]
IYRVEDQHPINTERLNQMKTSIVELLKAVQTLVERKHAPSPRRTEFKYGPTKHELKHSSNNPNIRDTDVRLFEVTEKAKPKEDEYLMIYVSEDEALFNVRNLVKDGDQM